VIVDTSALVAIIRGEPDTVSLLTAMNAADRVRISADTLLETSIVVTPAAHRDLDELVETAAAVIEPFDREQALAAREAYARYGKGSGSPARLNLGDCFAYALAMTTGEPLLFTGDDFTHTDVTPAYPA
jgi:ribonuclease VapC